MISKGSHVKFARFVFPAISNRRDNYFFVQCIIKQSLDSGGFCDIQNNLRLRLITPTSTLIMLDITKTSSNNCLVKHWVKIIYRLIKLFFSRLFLSVPTCFRMWGNVLTVTDFIYTLLKCFRACWHWGGWLQLAEVTRLSGVTRLSIQSLSFNWSWLHDSWGGPLRWVDKSAKWRNPDSRVRIFGCKRLKVG